MTIRRIALIYDDRPRPETTGVYCHRALKELAEVRHFRPDQVDEISKACFDLFLSIDDGLRYHFPEHLRPSAFWAIDTHMDLPWYLTKAKDFDFVFTAQKDGAEELRNAGIASAQWLPLACDPELQRRFDIGKTWDIAFVGTILPGPRQELLALIQERFPNSFVGQCYFEEMAKVYSSARIIFNRSVKNDLNMRVFEALCSGSLLITNEIPGNGLDELFTHGKHLVTYGSSEELLARISYYLKHAGERQATAAAGRDEVLARHTYRHRMERLLEVVESRRSTTGRHFNSKLRAEARSIVL